MKPLLIIMCMLLILPIAYSIDATFRDGAAFDLAQIKVSLADSDLTNRVSAVSPVDSFGDKVYSGVLPDTDISYKTLGNMIKETITLKTKPKYDRLKFNLDLSKYKYSIDSDTQIIHVLDKEQFLVQRYKILRPFYTVDGKDFDLNMSYEQGVYSIDLSPLPNINFINPNTAISMSI